MKSIWLVIPTILIVFFSINNPVFAQTTPQENLSFSCEFPHEIQGEQNVDICVTNNGSNINAHIIFGAGKIDVKPDPNSNTHIITFTPANTTSLMGIEISEDSQNENQKIFTTFFVTQDPNNPQVPLAEKNFSDVPTTHPNSTAIKYLSATGIIEGYPDGTYKPDQEINRAEILKLIIEGQQLKLDSATLQNCFPDVQDQWFAKYVCYAKNQNWIEGYPDENKQKDQWLFKPANPLNKAESLKIILNGFQIDLANKETPTDFKDVEKNSWYEKFINESVFRNIIPNNTGNYFPGKNIDRGEVAEIIYRIFLIKKNNVTKFDEALN